jgi:hypothetical protein
LPLLPLLGMYTRLTGSALNGSAFCCTLSASLVGLRGEHHLAVHARRQATGVALGHPPHAHQRVGARAQHELCRLRTFFRSPACDAVGFPRASHPADHEPTTHVEVGTGHRARTWNYALNITSVDPPIGSSLNNVRPRVARRARGVSPVRRGPHVAAASVTSVPACPQGLFLPIFDELSDSATVASLSAEAEEVGWHGVFACRTTCAGGSRLSTWPTRGSRSRQSPSVVTASGSGRW